ncbi:MAG: hypothetical protein R3Y64_11490 [Peptostreptococcaceae bacterium]
MSKRKINSCDVKEYMNKIFEETSKIRLIDYEQQIAYFSKHHNNKVRIELAESLKNFDEEFSEKYYVTY